MFVFHLIKQNEHIWSRASSKEIMLYAVYILIIMKNRHTQISILYFLCVKSCTFCRKEKTIFIHLKIRQLSRYTAEQFFVQKIITI